jgi:SAM-dependent methyltransferase
MTQSSDPKDSTLAYYEANAQRFADGTIDVDLSELYRHFLELLPTGGSILDAGCGPGRDIRYFSERGFQVVAFDNSPEMVRFASEYSGQDVLLLSFDEVDFQERFDGVWACSSTLHVPEKDMAGILRKLALALKPGGILYTSHKYGEGELMRGDRLFVDYTEQSFDNLLTKVLELELVRYYRTSDARPGRGDEKWLNILLRRPIRKS